MGEVVNLRMARKAAKRKAAEVAAHQNRARFGMTKAEKAVRDAEKARHDRAVDGARREEQDDRG